MVDQYAHEPCGVWSTYLDTLYAGETSELTSADTDVHLTSGELGAGRESPL